ncbi:hypothetical protein BDQ12DRAFT_763620 [Crucibulum laeve]|uniref:Uncharacterized protein n=1 Tax=Crucibulum laeve TaxID=68775 RepID=A0A5C3LQT1_9AGAR|nr:hypothetical protein BDQ12DRAFT_763620 [Crucibulum laeve]
MSSSMNNILAMPQTEKARRIVMAKGIFDVFLSLSLIFFPSLLYDGPVPATISQVTGLPKPSWEADPGAAYGLASLIMGAAFCGITAGQSWSPDAHKALATLNGVFALTGLIGCILSPQKFGSSFLLLASAQDVFWFSAIVKAGGYGVLDTLGLAGKRAGSAPASRVVAGDHSMKGGM